MAVTAVGFDGSVTEAQWATLMHRLAVGGWNEFVATGLTVTAATGTRLVRIATGGGIAAGVSFDSDSLVDLTLSDNTSGNPRIDYIVAEINWSTNAVTLKAVTGTPASSPVPPILTKSPGALWQLPLARVTVASGAGQLAGSAVTTCRPLARVDRPFTGAVAITTVSRGSSTPKVLSTLSIPDPGWPYYLVAAGNARLKTDGTSLGAILDAVVTASLSGVSERRIAVGRPAHITSGTGQQPCSLTPNAYPVLRGPATVQMRMRPAFATLDGSGPLETENSEENCFNVRQIPYL